MPGFPEYEQYDATGLAQLIRCGSVSAMEVLDAAIERMDAWNPTLNAVVHTTIGEARAHLGRHSPSLPFAGAPFLFKDLLQAQAGVPMRGGSAALRGYAPPVDSEYVRRVLAAGVIPVGRTNVPELGLMGTTEPTACGPTSNPWDLRHTPGGSSGGSAAAVAAGIVPMAGGSDGGGSIRIPAGWCGLFGLKPSRGRVPAGPYHADVWEGAVCEHVVSRSVRDSAAMLDALQGPDPGAPYTAIPAAGGFAEAAGRPPPALRIGFSTRSPVGMGVDRACREAVEAAAATLAGLGHHVEEAEPRIDGEGIARAYLLMNYAHTAALVDALPEQTGRAVGRGDLEPMTRAMVRLGHALSAGAYCASRSAWNTAARSMADFHRHYHLYLTPTAASAAPRLGQLRPDDGPEGLGIRLLGVPGAARAALALHVPERLARRMLAVTPFTQLANLTGQPAMSVPLHWSADGLPVGVQFIAPNGGEEQLFRLAGQLEEACPWFHRRPAITEAGESATGAHPWPPATDGG